MGRESPKYVRLPATGRRRVVFGNTISSTTEDEGTLYSKDFLTLKLSQHMCFNFGKRSDFLGK